MNNNNYELFLKAKELIKNKKYSKAIEVLRKINNLEPNDRVIKFELARVLSRNNQTKKEAKSLFYELLSTQSRTYAMLELGRLEASEGNNSKAREYFEELLNNTQDKTYAMLELGRLEASEGNNSKAREYFEELLNTQNRTYAMLELGRLEASEGNNSKARKYFEKLLNAQNRTYAIIEIIFLDIKNENYLDAYNRFNSNSFNFSVIEYEHLKKYLEYKLSKLDLTKCSSNDYFTSQLINYEESLALDHIKKHLDENNQKIKHTTFNENIDLKELFNYARIQIKELSPVKCTYVFKYILDCEQEISFINGTPTRYMGIIAFPHTNNIITMYPIETTEKHIESIPVYKEESNNKQLVKKPKKNNKGQQ